MVGLNWIMTIIVGGLAGWVAEKVMKADHGLITNVILGISGAVVLNFVLRLVGIIPPGGILPQLIVAVIGACVLIFGYRAIKGRG